MRAFDIIDEHYAVTFYSWTDPLLLVSILQAARSIGTAGFQSIGFISLFLVIGRFFFVWKNVGFGKGLGKATWEAGIRGGETLCIFNTSQGKLTPSSKHIMPCRIHNTCCCGLPEPFRPLTPFYTRIGSFSTLRIVGKYFESFLTALLSRLFKRCYFNFPVKDKTDLICAKTTLYFDYETTLQLSPSTSRVKILIAPYWQNFFF